MRTLESRLWSAGIAVATVLACAHPMRNADLWWHLAAGRAIWAGGGLPRLDPFSFPEQTRPWLNHEWLADLVFYAWQSALGLEGLVAWLVLVYVATYTLFFRLLCARGAWPSAAAFATLSALALVRPFIEFRPGVYSLLGTVLLLTWLQSSKRRLVPLVLLFATWANVHSGVILGLALLALWTAIELALRPEMPRGPALRAGAGALVASVLTPHGLDGLFYPLRYALRTDWPYLTIKEWLPPFAPNAVEVAALPLFLGALAAATAWLLRRWTRYRDSDLLPVLSVALLTLAMALRSARFVPLLGIGGGLLLASALRSSRPAVASQPPGGLRLGVLLAALLLVGAGLTLTRYRPGPGLFAILASEATFPVDLVDFVEQERLKGRAYAYYGWGGYLHWRTNGALKVAIDSRADTVFDGEDYLGYVRVQYGHPGWLDVIERSGAQFFLWPHPTEQVPWAGQARELIATGRWRMVREDFSGVLLARADVAVPASQIAGRSESESPYALLGRARVAMVAGDEVRAEALLRRVLELRPRLREACHNLALVQVHNRDYAAAQSTHRRCQAIFPLSSATRHLEAAMAKRRAER